MPFIHKAALILISIALLFAAGCNKSDTRSKESAPANQIKSVVVDFPGMQLRSGSDNATFTLVGRIRNRSVQQTVTGVKLRLIMEDVLATGATTTVGDTMVTLQVQLLPGESKSFSENVSFNKLPSPIGRHEWKYSIVEISEKK